MFLKFPAIVAPISVILCKAVFYSQKKMFCKPYWPISLPAAQLRFCFLFSVPISLNVSFSFRFTFLRFFFFFLFLFYLFLFPTSIYKQRLHREKTTKPRSTLGFTKNSWLLLLKFYFSDVLCASPLQINSSEFNHIFSVIRLSSLSLPLCR